MIKEKSRLLVVDDDPELLRILMEELSEAEYICTGCDNGQDALLRLRQEEFDLVVLDWTMPDFTGIDISKRLRSTGNYTPILMLTARDDTDERVLALDTGIDDYLTKPFEIKELQARIRSNLRRVNYEKSASNELQSIEIDNLKIDIISHHVSRGDRSINLSNKEYELLKHLVKNINQIQKRETIIESVWGENFVGDPNVLDVYIGYLRKKVEWSGEPQLIHTVRGVGFMAMVGPAKK